MDKQVLTLATGKKLYVDLAVNLARSFWKWNQQSSIAFYIVTDASHFIPADVLAYVKIIEIKPGELGEGFSPKLHLDRIAPTGQTLFIDSDCLIFDRLDQIFELFAGKSVAVVGNYVSEGEWFGDIRSICQKFNLSRIPKFNGGIYYLEKGPIATKVYETARELELSYDEIGFKRLRNRPNDEVVMALAMELNHMVPLIDDSTIMSDPQACPGGYDLDVISGKRYLINPPAPDPLHQEWYPFHRVEPVIFHFLGYYTLHYPYKREVYRLNKYLSNQLNLGTEIKAKLFIEWPEILKIKLKNSLRPLYRKVFGTRKIAKSERVV